MWIKFMIPLLLAVAFTVPVESQRRVRLRQRPVQVESEEDVSQEEINRPIVSFYRAEPRQDEQQQDLVYINNDDDYYQQQTPTPRPRTDYRPATTARSHTVAPKTKVASDSGNKAPPVQTIRNYNKINDDGSFTFGYEAADGSFKEETRGTDCVVRGKYGYIDPEGNRREFTYVSGNPCDPNNPDGSDEEKNNSEEDSDENIPQNYPKRPIPRPRPTQAPTTRAPTTVFQNRYNTQDVSEEEEDEPIQYAQIPKTTSRPFIQTERPRVQIHTTPAPTLNYPASPINITPKPLYRVQNTGLSVQPVTKQTPPTTYRPQTVSFVTQKPITQSVYQTKAGGFQSTTRAPIDFDNEFQKFQQENSFSPSPKPATAAPVQITSPKQSNKIANSPIGTTGNPIYQSQLIYNPSTGQYDSNLYQSIAQTDSEFQLSHRIQPFVQQYQIPQQQSFFNQSPSPLYNRNQFQAQQPQIQAQPKPQQQQRIPQEIYQQQQNSQQFLNSQQLFAQQLQLQQSQLQRDRIEAQKKVQPVQSTQIHRFQLPQSAPLRQQLQQPAQQYYYVSPQGDSVGQIDGFLRAHNIEY